MTTEKTRDFMRVERTPITVYDFFGYFIPGFIFLCLMFYTFKKDYIVSTLREINGTKTVVDDILLGVFFIFFSYITGHILSYLSHFSIDRWVKEKFFQQKTGCKFCGCFFLKELERKVFNPDEVEKYIKGACVKYIEKRGIENNEKKEIDKLMKHSDGRLGKISGLLSLQLSDPVLWQATYNMLVLSGMFRTITMAFFIYIVYLLGGYYYFCKHLVFFTPDCEGGAIDSFTFWCVVGISTFVTVISFMIYCKFLRRHIEKTEAAIVFYDFNEGIQKENSKLPKNACS